MGLVIDGKLVEDAHCPKCGQRVYTERRDPCTACGVVHPRQHPSSNELCSCGAPAELIICGSCGGRRPCRLHGLTGPRRLFCRSCYSETAW